MIKNLEQILGVTDLNFHEQFPTQKFPNSETREERGWFCGVKYRENTQYFGNVICAFKKDGKQYGISIPPEEILVRKENNYKGWFIKGNRTWLQFDESKFLNYLKDELSGIKYIEQNPMIKRICPVCGVCFMKDYLSNDLSDIYCSPDCLIERDKKMVNPQIALRETGAEKAS